MVTFIDISDSILHIRNESKQKATVELILIQLKKKEKYKDLTLWTLEKEIATLTEAGMLHNNDNDSIFIKNVLNAPTKEQTIVNKERKKTQTSKILRKVHQQMTLFNLMKIHQLSQIGLKLQKIFSFMKFLILEVKWKTCMNITKLMIRMLNVIKGWSWWKVK